MKPVAPVVPEPKAHVETTVTLPAETQPAVVEQPIVVTAPVSLDGAQQYHVVFSTDCSFFQDWQTLLIFHSATVVKQPGKISRIASGCSEKQQKGLLTLYQKLYPQYGVHFTPDFKTDGKTKKKYDFYNKPYGVHHWLQNAQPPIVDHTIVIILDPDMIFLRPITSQIRENKATITLRSFNPAVDTIPLRVERGQPAAQLYGLGAPWAAAHPKHFNVTDICGAGSNCGKTPQRYGEAHYSVGPPYLLESGDLLRLTNSWTQMVPRVYSKYPNLLAEMYAYSMAAAHEQLPHFTVENMMVSNTDAYDEGWKWVDQLKDDVCVPPTEGIYYPDLQMPSVVHFCQFFRAGELGFQKRRIKKALFDCDAPMMEDPPLNLGTVKYKNRDGTNMPLSRVQARRNAFMLCTIHRSINAMVGHYKDVMCDKSQFVNRNKSINVVAKGFY
ncbi:hypothetical protein B484DRAFT_394152 [Ochromonadaceae sp. CCMP2298]|nr:hypothetical protein B484DRAFT_394152 [Ochromonadaceae sp. CCMP2298]